MDTGALGKTYRDGEPIVRQGEAGGCLYVIQAGQVEVVAAKEGREVRLAVLGEGDFFGEMSILERQVRSATARALGEARVLTIDKKGFLRRVHEDPSLALRIMEKLCHRIRELDAEVLRLKGGG